MDPLRNRMDADDPVLARLARILTAARQPPASSEMRERVRAALRRRGRGAPALWFKVAMAGALACVFAATTWAMWAKGLRVRLSRRAPVPVAAPLDSGQRVAPAPTIRPSVSRAAAPAPVEASRRPVSRGGEERRLPSQVGPPALRAELDAVLVLDAIAALRREHDPARARERLDLYAKRNPNGPLIEEALALSIEAAMAEGDARAVVLADRYLARYPTGRFRAAAQQARQHFGH